MPSTVIAYIKYNASKEILEIGYNSGAVYHYKKVPEAIYAEMTNAFSKGVFLNRHIKGNYDFIKIK